MALILTPGEPAGIGPDICLQLMAGEQHAGLRSCTVIIADPELMRTRSRALQLPLQIAAADDWDQALSLLGDDRLTVLRQPLLVPAQAGKLDDRNARYVLDCLDTAIALCSDGRADALVTGPVHKGIINQAGNSFSGHTEYLAAPSGSEPVMMLATDAMRVVLATTHLPLRNVADAIDEELLVSKITTTWRFLQQRFRTAAPRIIVLGLNPHAGEDGHLGTEDRDIITPAVQRLRAQGMDIVGPLPADTAFTGDRLQNTDAFFAMYHDQGLPVLKYSGFGKAVNITMGLPFLRTSVDHGTALELAGSGRAECDSLDAAIRLASHLSARGVPQ